MQRAIELAMKGRHNVSPNPLVGAVIVKNNKIIGQGYHKKFGSHHAEVEALKDAKVNLLGATMYVSLEPCCFSQKTPPCIDAILTSGIKKVVIATLDPNPKVNGRGVKILRKNGIEVDIGLLKQEADELNEIFIKNMKKNLPFVVVKTAQSIDGKITTHKNESRWITTKKSRDFSKELRDKYDAVLVGINTVLKDNPTLNGKTSKPHKVILDPSLKISFDCELIKKFPEKVIIVCKSGKGEAKSKRLTKQGVKVIQLKPRVYSVKNILRELFKLGIMSVFVEGGSFTIGKFFDGRFVDKVYFFIAPKIIGGVMSLPSVGGLGFSTPQKSAEIKKLEIKMIGKDILVSGYPIFKK